MNIETLKNVKESSYFYNEAKEFLTHDCQTEYNLLQSIAQNSEVEITKENETHYLQTIRFFLEEDEGWRNELFSDIEHSLESIDYREVNDILDSVIIEEMNFFLEENKIYNHRTFVYQEEVHVEIKHPLLQAFFGGYDTKSSLRYLKEIDEPMYNQFFSDENLIGSSLESFIHNSKIKVEEEKIKKWERYKKEALDEFSNYFDVYEKIKSELYGSVLDETIECYHATMRENMY